MRSVQRLSPSVNSRDARHRNRNSNKYIQDVSEDDKVPVLQERRILRATRGRGSLHDKIEHSDSSGKEEQGMIESGDDEDESTSDADNDDEEEEVVSMNE